MSKGRSKGKGVGWGRERGGKEDKTKAEVSKQHQWDINGV